MSFDRDISLHLLCGSSASQVHGSVGEPWWLWVEDPVNDHIYHSEYFLLQKKQVGVLTSVKCPLYMCLYY